MGVFMDSRRELEKEMTLIKKQVKLLKGKTAAAKKTMRRVKSDKVGSDLLVLLKYLMDENRKTTVLLQTMSTSISRIETELNGVEVEEIPPATQPLHEAPVESEKREILPISAIDASIIELIQRAPNNMLCADDIKEKLHYKGRNAACTRLNRLHKAGLLERHQLGHKVYYKYDAGKATKLLILSPPK